MTTISEIVTEAFRENNLIQVGDVPDGAEYLEAERLLTRFIKSIFGSEFGESLKTISVSSSQDTLPINSRVLIDEDSPDVITLSELPQDGEQFAVLDPRGLLTSMTIEAGGGTIENATSVTLDSTSPSYQWFYRGDKGNWYKVTDLTSEDDSPLPEEFDDLLSIWLSIRISPRMGAQTTQESATVYDAIKKKFTSRYKQSQEIQVEPGLLFMTNPTCRYILNWNTGN